MISRFINDRKYNWKIKNIDSIDVLYVGRYKSIFKLIEYFKKGDPPNISEIKIIVNQMPGNFAIIVETNSWIFGLVDRIGGYRLFYRNDDTGCILSNSPRKLINKEQGLTFNQDSVLELKMLGYLSGNTTIDKNIFQLRSGEMLLCNKNSNNYTISSYFIFYTPSVRHQSDKILIEELDDITNKTIVRNIEDANGRTIWVPLSGGLDSRLIICKLKELGCDNLRAYSYGVPGNFDAIRAKEIAHTLGIKWDFIHTDSTEARRYFLSKERERYWDFSDGLSVVPSFHGMFALRNLINSKTMKPDDVVINGQSGDFIAGEHIPLITEQGANNEALLDHILNKNYSMRREMLRSSDLADLMKVKIRNILGEFQYVSNYQEFAKSYEYWGWRERQTKRVINGQCNYSYFELNWELPFWDVEYLNFWANIPIKQKADRRLFVEYLNKMDFYGVFKNNNKFMSRWPLNRIYIQFIGNILSKTLGNKVSNQYYKRLDWYSQYQYLYSLTGKIEYKKHWANYKAVYPYMTDIWLSENLKL